jgi:hypothetical protein
MNAVALQKVTAIESALIEGDLSKLSDIDRLNYFKSVCESVGLNPLTKPFDYIRLNGKLVLYAKRDATDQLRKIHKVSINISSRENIGDVYVVTARAKDAQGREDESTGAVAIAGLRGDALANAYMKAETKAKRRVTLSVCGLGLLDESEIDSIPNIVTQAASAPAVPIEAPKEEIHPDDPAKYMIQFGKFKGKRVDEVSPSDLDSYCRYIVSEAEKKGKPINGVVLDFVSAAGAYLNDLDGEQENRSEEKQ